MYYRNMFLQTLVLIKYQGWMIHMHTEKVTTPQVRLLGTERFCVVMFFSLDQSSFKQQVKGVLKGDFWQDASKMRT